MELRKRHQYRRTESLKLTPSGKAAAMILSVIVLSAMFACSSIGTWCAERIFEPYYLRQTKEWEDTAAEALQSDQVRASRAYTLAVQPCYALQTGAFESYENALSHALALQSRGGAGHIYEKDGICHVFAAGYPSMDEAISVQKQLSDTGLDCTVYTINGGQKTLSFSGDREKLESYCGCLHEISRLPERLYQLSLLLDKNQISFDACRTRIAALEDELKQICSTLKSSSQMNTDLDRDLLSLLEWLMHETDDMLGEDHINRAEFGSAIRRGCLQVASELSQILEDL